MKNRTHGLTEREMELARLLMADCKTTGDVQARLKRLFAGTIEQMLEAEMDEHLGYEKNSVEGNNSGNSRNGYGKKTISSDYGDCEISVPRDRNGGAVATIVPREDSRVPVVLWEISERDERNLDRYEGFPRLYFKKVFRVYLGKRKVSAFAYIMADGYAVGVPSEYYYNTILEGYTDNGIDTKPLFAALFAAREHHSVR